MSREELIQILKEVVSVELINSSSYIGGIDGSGRMYIDQHTIQLKIDDEVVSEIYL